MHQETKFSSSNPFLEHHEWHKIHLSVLAVTWFTQRDIINITLKSCGVLLFYMNMGLMLAMVAWYWINKLCEGMNSFIIRNDEEPPLAPTGILKCDHCQYQKPMIPVLCHLCGFNDFHMSSKEWLPNPAWLCTSLDVSFFKYVLAVFLVLQRHCDLQWLLGSHWWQLSR